MLIDLANFIRKHPLGILIGLGVVAFIYWAIVTISSITWIKTIIKFLTTIWGLIRDVENKVDQMAPWGGVPILWLLVACVLGPLLLPLLVIRWLGGKAAAQGLNASLSTASGNSGSGTNSPISGASTNAPTNAPSDNMDDIFAQFENG
ncbi:MAG TPA: hypothetical protein VMQ76_10725 [Terracidiphilus sp.]|nr:hypothetical protein [Terracidiphilus sp.]